jgi:tripartite-type tricarboxylate transporter receptor subunit TctC
MAGGHGVNFGMDRIETFVNLSSKNRNMGIVGVSCPKRLSAHPMIPTLAEQGIISPSVFNIVVANQAMNSTKQHRIGKILTQATVAIGEDRIFSLSGFVPAVFNNQTAHQHFVQNTTLIQQLRDQHRDKIQTSR